MVSPAQTSAQFLCFNMSPASNSTGRRKSELGRKVGRGKSILEMAGPDSILWLLLAVGRDFSSPHWALLLLVWISIPKAMPQVFHSCHPLWLHCSISWTFDLPFLWIFPPLTPYCLPSLLLEYFLPEVCQTLNHLFACPCSGRNSQQGEQQQRLVYLLVVFCLFLTFFFPPLLLPPHNKINSCAQKVSLAILTTLTTSFSNLSLCMSWIF